MNISVHFSDDEAELIKQYAKMNNMTVSQLMRHAVIERIEDEYDLEIYKQALQAFKEDKTVYSHDEVKKMLLDDEV